MYNKYKKLYMQMYNGVKSSNLDGVHKDAVSQYNNHQFWLCQNWSFQ